jgi:hypothetical protein
VRNQFGQPTGFLVTTFSHTIASASPLEASRSWAVWRAEWGAGSPGEFLNRLIPRNLRKRRLLHLSDLYRGFESFFLRHASLICREFPLALRRNTRIMPVFRNISSSNRTAENGLLVGEGGTIPAFLQKARAQSGFTEGHEANAMRS